LTSIAAEKSELFRREEAMNSALMEIKDILEDNGKLLSDFGLPEPVSVPRLSRLLREQLDYDSGLLAEEANALVAMMNVGQKTAYDCIIAAIDSAGFVQNCS
jgi:hypothetical protein